jgi:hypothetical protein
MKLSKICTLICEQEITETVIDNFLDELENKYPNFTRFSLHAGQDEEAYKKFYIAYNSGKYNWEFLVADSYSELIRIMKPFIMTKGWKKWAAIDNFDSAAGILYKKK